MFNCPSATSWYFLSQQSSSTWNARASKAGAVPPQSPSWIFIHDTDKVKGGLMVLFFVLFFFFQFALQKQEKVLQI